MPVIMAHCPWTYCLCFFNDTATTEIYTLSLHDALPIFIVDQRLPLPGQTDERKQPVFDLVPLARCRRVKADRDGHPQFVRQFLQGELPSPGSAAVTPPGIGADQDSIGPRLPVGCGQFR